MQIPAYDLVRVNAPHRAALAAATTAVLDSGQLILGPHVSAFERDFARACGVSNCVGTGNGLDALALTLEALGIGPGDEVIVPAFTFIATWLSVVRVGAHPVPVDVREDGLLDPAQLRTAITSRCRAIVPVHLYGKLADMGPILSVAASHGLSVVEDAAQAHGAERDGKRAGSFGIASAFSFYPTKNLGALGDGGAICTSDPELAARLRRLHNYGSDRKYLHEIIGHNSRLDELQAAYLAVKLPHLLSSNARRRQIAARYSRALMPVAHDGLQLAALSDGSVWHQFVIRVANRRPVQQALAADGIGTTIHYPVAPFDQACFAGQFDRTRFPVATRLAETVLSLPMGDYLSDEEVDYVIHSVQNACQPVAA